MKIKPTKTKEKEAPPKFMGRFTRDGGLEFGEYVRIFLKTFIRKNPGMPFELKPLLPESKNQRGYFEGGVCTLVAFYQEGMDHHDSKDREKVREWLKIEFNGEYISIAGKSHQVAQSTKNRLNQGFLERVTNWLIENYSPPIEALDPKKYKHWEDTVFPYGGPDNYIDYLISLKIL